jgi:hypothetical protein
LVRSVVPDYPYGPMKQLAGCGEGDAFFPAA